MIGTSGKCDSLQPAQLGARSVGVESCYFGLPACATDFIDEDVSVSVWACEQIELLAGRERKTFSGAPHRPEIDKWITNPDSAFASGNRDTRVLAHVHSASRFSVNQHLEITFEGVRHPRTQDGARPDDVHGRRATFIAGRGAGHLFNGRSNSARAGCGSGILERRGLGATSDGQGEESKKSFHCVAITLNWPSSVTARLGTVNAPARISWGSVARMRQPDSVSGHRAADMDGGR